MNILNNSNSKKAFVRRVSQEERIQISFGFPTDQEREDLRVFNFDRPKNEELEKTLLRIATNVTKEVNKKLVKKAKKKKLEEKNVENFQQIIRDNNRNKEDCLLKVSLISSVNGEKISNSTNKDVWIEGSVLEVGDEKFQVEVNLPSAKECTLPNVMMSNFPIFPKLSLEFCNISECQTKWFVEKKKDTQTQIKAKKEEENSCNISTNAKNKHLDLTKSGEKLKRDEDWTFVGCSEFFIPQDHHINLLIKITCLPRCGERVGVETSFISKCRVQLGPKNCPFERRHLYTQHFLSEGFRIISYNILADLYADSDYSRDFLFPYCLPHFLHIDYRKQLILKEIIGYHGDVICLQEVDKKVFEEDLKQGMEGEGYEGLLMLKKGQVAEGCATFFRKNKFDFVNSYDLGLVEYLQTEPSLDWLKKKLSANQSLGPKVLERTSVLQVTLLKHKPKKHTDEDNFLLVATVHLYFHPRAAHVRLIQAHICTSYLQQLFFILTRNQKKKVNLIFCGDFNAYSGSGVHEYLINGRVSNLHADWYTGGKVEYLENMNLNHDLQLHNLSGFPSYTNYVGGFNACLDYIYASKSLSLSSCLPMPSHEEVTKHTALPNQFFPSDHIAIGCDVNWIPVDYSHNNNNNNNIKRNNNNYGDKIIMSTDSNT